MALNESAEMYLETIYTLSQKKANVRSIDVAEALGYSRPSVSRAVGLLKKDGFLTMDADGYLKLTQTGFSAAGEIYERHILLTAALVSLGVDEDTASEDACRIEHVISRRSLAAIRSHMRQCGKGTV